METSFFSGDEFLQQRRQRRRVSSAGTSFFSGDEFLQQRRVSSASFFRGFLQPEGLPQHVSSAGGGGGFADLLAGW